MKQATKKIEPPIIEPAPSRSINAKFSERIPHIVEAIWGSWIAIKPHIQQASVAARELADFVDFEISKVKLEIKTMEWESRSDADQLDQARSWLKRLEDFRSEFDPTKVESSPNFMSDLSERIRNTFM